MREKSEQIRGKDLRQEAFEDLIPGLRGFLEKLAETFPALPVHALRDALGLPPTEIPQNEHQAKTSSARRVL